MAGVLAVVDPIADTLLSLTAPEADPAVLLRSLTTASVRLLDVDAAAVQLVEADRLVPAAATDDSTDELDELQTRTRQGPCPDCVDEGRAVFSTDLDADGDRWPDVSAAARREGFRSVHAEPMRLGDDVLGALNLFRHDTGPLTERDHRHAAQLAAAASIGLLHRRALDRVETVNAQLQGALESRIDIEQAKGALGERYGLSPEAAFAMLRAEARRRRVPLRQIARAVRDSRPGAGPLPGPPPPAPRRPSTDRAKRARPDE